MKRVVWLLVLLLALSACDPGASPTADDLMPDAIGGYKITEGKNLTEAITRLAEGASLLAGQPEIALAVEGVDRIMQCYEDAGAVSGRIFTKEGDVLSSGVIVIVDRNRLTNPQTFLDCVRPQSGPEMTQAESLIEPCGATYTLNRDNNAYYILYAGTRPEVCKTFCGTLEGCTQ